MFVRSGTGRLDVEESYILAHLNGLCQILMTGFVITVDQVDDMNHDTSSDGGGCIVPSFEGEDGLGLD